MRLDFPHDLPRPRKPEEKPLELSPLEQRREKLAKRAAENRGPQTPPPRPERPIRPDRPREPKDRSVSVDRPRDHRPRRQDLPLQAVNLALREEEQRVLSEVGRFRVIATRDLAGTVYANRASRMDRDLAFLREHGLVEVNAVNA